MSSLGLLEAKIIPKLRTTGNYCHDCYFCGYGGGEVVGCAALVVGGGNVCGDWGVLALVLDFREVMLTSHPELAHCASPLLSENIRNRPTPPPPLVRNHVLSHYNKLSKTRF